MATTYTIELDGYTFPRGDLPFHGPFIEINEQIWSEQPVLGLASPGTILTFVGTESQVAPMRCRASLATKNKLVAIHAARKEVVLKTPQNTDGFKVLLRDLRVPHEAAIEDGKYLCTFTLTSREAASGATDPGAGGPPDEEDAPVIVRKSVTETVNNSDTLQNDNELFLAVGAGETWVVFFNVFHTGIATGDFQAGWTGPSGATMFGNAVGKTTADAVVVAPLAALGVGQNFGATVAVRVYTGSLILTNAATAGNLQLQWAQAVAEASDLRVLAGSYLAGFKQ